MDEQSTWSAGLNVQELTILKLTFNLVLEEGMISNFPKPCCWKYYDMEKIRGKHGSNK